MQSKSYIKLRKKPWLNIHSKSTSAPSKNIPQHLANKIHDAVRPKSENVALEEKNTRTWPSDRAGISKTAGTGPISKWHKSQPPPDESTTAPAKVVESARKVFEKPADASVPSQVDASKKMPDIQQGKQEKSGQHSETKTKSNKDAFHKDTATSTPLKGTTQQGKGAFEDYWSEFRMQGPPPATASSSSQSSSASESRARGSLSKSQKVLTAERLSHGENYRTRDQGLSKSQPKHGTTSKWPPRGGQKTIYAKDRQPESKGKSEDESPAEKSQKTGMASVCKASRLFNDRTLKKEDSRTSGSTKSRAGKPTSVTDDHGHRQEKHSSEVQATTKPVWYWKVMSKIGIPDHLPETTSAASETSTEDVKETIPEQGAARKVASRKTSPKEKESTKVETTVPATSFTEILKHDMKSLFVPDVGITPSAKPPRVTDKRPTESKPKVISSSKSTAHRPGEKLVDSIVEAAQDLKIVAPSAVATHSWIDRTSNIFDLSWMTHLLAESKTAISFVPDIFTSKLNTSCPPSKNIMTWKSWLLTSTNLGSQTTIRDQTPSEKAWEEKFISTHPNYQVQISRSEPAQSILEISGALYSIIDQLMAEGNKHFDTMTRLQGAWEGLFRAEAVMDSSRTVRTMASDAENRKLLRSYVEVVHKLDRLVDGVSEATNRMANSTDVDVTDARQWPTMRNEFNKFLWEVKKRPLFVDKGLLVSEGFHRDILLSDKEKLESAKVILGRLQQSSVV